MTVTDFTVCPEPERSSEKYTRAIYFHPDEGAPRFVWLKTEQVKEDEYSDAALLAHPGALAANNKKEAKSGKYICMKASWIQHNYALDRELPYTVYVSYRDDFLHDRSKHNKASDKIIDSQSPYLHD
jgi:hypothetical protein